MGGCMNFQLLDIYFYSSSPAGFFYPVSLHYILLWNFERQIYYLINVTNVKNLGKFKSSEMARKEIELLTKHNIHYVRV